jgi:predicted ATPase
MAYPGAEILLLDDDGIRRVRYEETDHYVLTREFLNGRERMLAELFAPDAPAPTRPLDAEG